MLMQQEYVPPANVFGGHVCLPSSGLFQWSSASVCLSVCLHVWANWVFSLTNYLTILNVFFAQTQFCYFVRMGFTKTLNCYSFFYTTTSNSHPNSFIYKMWLIQILFNSKIIAFKHFK